MDLSAGDPAGSTADPSDTPAGRAHRTEWQHRTPETWNRSLSAVVSCLHTNNSHTISLCYNYTFMM